MLAPPGSTLFALTPEVEERVVDADREADQEDDLGDRLVDRDELAGQGDQLVVAKTAVIARSSGSSAATAEPNTSSRITSVSGRAIIPAFASMLLNAESTAFSV